MKLLSKNEVNNIVKQSEQCIIGLDVFKVEQCKKINTDILDLSEIYNKHDSFVSCKKECDRIVNQFIMEADEVLLYDAVIIDKKNYK